MTFLTCNISHSIQTNKSLFSDEIVDKRKLTSGVSDANNIDYDLYKIKINHILATTFGKSFHARQICSIVTDYLGYSSCDKANSRFEKFIEKCNAIIRKKNLKKTINAKAAVILQTNCDPIEAFSSGVFFPRLKQLAKSYYIALGVIGFQGETLGNALKKVAQKLEGRSIMTLILRFHAKEKYIQLGDRNYYDVTDVAEGDFSLLNPKASVILDACLAGCDLAYEIAMVRKGAPVFANISVSNQSFLAPCCVEHGYGLVAFDPSQNPITRVFTSHESQVTEKLPCFSRRREIEQIKKTLLQELMSAVGKGDIIAQRNLGCSYKISGRGVAQSFNKAVDCFFRAAMEGNSLAQYNLGVCYYNGQGVHPSYEKAVKWYLQGAERGDPSSLFNLGICFVKGQGLLKSYKNGAFCYQLAAEQGEASAQYQLGVCYYNGQGVPKCYQQATEWYLASSNQGHASAQYQLSICYFYGQGVSQSYELAAKWCLEAAERENVVAQFNLGSVYYKGLGVEPSLERAIYWMTKAAEQRYDSATEKLNFFMKKMNGERA